MRNTILKSFLALILLVLSVKLEDQTFPEKAVQSQSVPKPQNAKVERSLTVNTSGPSTRTDAEGRKLCGCGLKSRRILEEIPDRVLPEHVNGGARPVDMYRGKPNQDTQINNIMHYLQEHPDEDNGDLYSYLCCQDHDHSHSISNFGPNILPMQSSAMTSQTIPLMIPLGNPIPQNLPEEHHDVFVTPDDMMKMQQMEDEAPISLPMPMTMDHDEDDIRPRTDGALDMMNPFESEPSRPPIIMGMVQETKTKRLPNGQIRVEHIQEPINEIGPGGMMFGKPQIEIDTVPLPNSQHSIEHQTQHFAHVDPFTGATHHAITSQTKIQHQHGPDPIGILFHNLLGGMIPPKPAVKTITEEILIPKNGGKPIIRKEIHEVHHNIHPINPPGMMIPLPIQQNPHDELMFNPDDEILFHSDEHHHDMQNPIPHKGTEIIEIIGGPHHQTQKIHETGDINPQSVMDAMIKSLLLGKPVEINNIHKAKAAQTVHVARTSHDPKTGKIDHQQVIHHQEVEHHVHPKSDNERDHSHPTSLIDGLLDDLAGEINNQGGPTFQRHKDDHSEISSSIFNSSVQDHSPHLDDHLLPQNHDPHGYPIMNEQYKNKQIDLGKDDVSNLLKALTSVESHSQNTSSSPTATNSEFSDLGHLLNGIQRQKDQESVASDPLNAILDTPQDHSSIYPTEMHDQNNSMPTTQNKNPQTSNINQTKDLDEDWEEQLLNSFLGKLKKRTRAKKKIKKKTRKNRAKLSKKKRRFKLSRQLRRDNRLENYLGEIEDIYNRNKELMKQNNLAKEMFMNRILNNKNLLKSYFVQKINKQKTKRERRERRLQLMSRAEKKLEEMQQELGDDRQRNERRLAEVKNGVSNGSFESKKREALKEFRAALDKMKPRQP